MKIALVGPGAVGKDMLSEHAAQRYGLKHISSGDIIRKHIVDNKLGEPDRINCRKVGTELRARYGSDILVRKSIEMHSDDVVLSGLRTVAEATTFKKLGGIIISVTAPAALRYQWVKDRGDIDSSMTLEQLEERDRIESSNPDPNAQNINAVMALADFEVVNDADKETLLARFDAVADGIKARGKIGE